MAVFYDTVKKQGKLQIKQGSNGGDELSVVRKFSAISQLSVKIPPLSVTSKFSSVIDW